MKTFVFTTIVFWALLATASDTVTVCSFNCQWLGNSRQRDNQALVNVLKPFDIVVIQELVAPPYSGIFPDKTPVNPDPEAAAFFDAMKVAGFSYILSEEDTGTGDNIHQNGSGTEWWVAFYKPKKATVATDLPQGFLARERANHADYERVPYAFAFRAGEADFVLISVHLQPGPSPASRERRKHELASIVKWIKRHDDTEKDFIILGDMNIENEKELASATPAVFVSLNSKCVPTNTNPVSPKPYDHVMFRPEFTTEIDRSYGFKIHDLVGEFKPRPYNHTKFRMKYSDHNPVYFRIVMPKKDDD